MDLVTELTGRCDAVIESELTRLGRRQPGLTAGELVVIEQALSELANRLLLDALRTNPALRAQVQPLFEAGVRSGITEP